MTKQVDTGFERHFSEPPVLAVKEGRTHCEACKEALDPTVMHKCHGNQEYQPVISYTEITEACPACHEKSGKLFNVGGGPYGNVVICEACHTFVSAPVEQSPDAVYAWNAIISARGDIVPEGGWPKWHALLPGDDERISTALANVLRPSTTPTSVQRPDLTNYRGVCPISHVEGQDCHLCENTGVIPPTKPVEIPPLEIVVPGAK